VERTSTAPAAEATPYRWVVLAAFMAVNLTIQVLWISYAPVTSAAGDYYGVSEVAIGALAMSFMVAYLPLSLPASAAIAHRGFRAAAGFGALLAGVAGVARGLAGPHYVPVLLATLGAAVAQPFLLNAWTTLSTHWFPPTQRATAVSLVTLANLVGAGVGLALTPQLERSMTIGRLQLWYGVAALAAGIVFVLVARDRPPLPPDPTDHEAVRDDTAELVGVRHALHVRPFVVFLAVAFVGMGVFNGISTWVEEIVRPRGFSSGDAGTLGALLLLGGVIGAVVLSAWSDRARKRVPFLTLSLTAAAPALVWLALARSHVGVFAAAFVLGFFLTSAMPIGMQYSAEITVPTPEGTTNGLIQLAGQASVVFVLLMELTRTSGGSFTPSLTALAALLLVGALLLHRLPEPTHHLALREALAHAGDQALDPALDPALDQVPDREQDGTP
jgi:sugar phosphate permease